VRAALPVEIEDALGPPRQGRQLTSSTPASHQCLLVAGSVSSICAEAVLRPQG
jgi:hypothetical protein